MPFPFHIRFRLQYRQDVLKDLPTILSQELRGSLEEVGKLLQISAQKRMKEDTGKTQKSLVRRVTGRGLNLNLEVYSVLIQAFIDAYGLRVGTRPPWGIGSNLYKWTSRRVKFGQLATINKDPYNPIGPRRVFNSGPSKLFKQRNIRRPKKVTRVNKGAQVRVANAGTRARLRQNAIKRVAFIISRSIYEKGIVPTYWNKRALDASKKKIIRELQNSITRTIYRIKQ